MKTIFSLRSMAAGGNLGSKLAQLSAKYNLCHSFQAFNTCYADTGLWGVYFVTDKLKIDDFMIALQDEWLGFSLISDSF